MTAETRSSLLHRLGDRKDVRAWHEFLSTYRDLILGYCARSGLQAADAEDVLQDVMLSMTRRMPSFRYDRRAGRFRGYLGQVVRHRVYRHLARAAPAESLDEGRGAEPGSDAIWEEEWRKHHLRRAMDVLRRSIFRDSMPVFERILSGQSIAEIARTTGLSEAAVHKIKQRGRDRLRDQVQAQIRLENQGGS